MDHEANNLAHLLGYVIMETGPVLIKNETIEEGLPDNHAVVIEQTQEGYIVFIAERGEDEQTE